MLQTPCVSSTENAFDNQLIISAFPSWTYFCWFAIHSCLLTCNVQ
jgi:hypothetical protein